MSSDGCCSGGVVGNDASQLPGAERCPSRPRSGPSEREDRLMMPQAWRDITRSERRRRHSRLDMAIPFSRYSFFLLLVYTGGQRWSSYSPLWWGFEAVPIEFDVSTCHVWAHVWATLATIQSLPRSDIISVVYRFVNCDRLEGDNSIYRDSHLEMRCLQVAPSHLKRAFLPILAFPLERHLTTQKFQLSLHSLR